VVSKYSRVSSGLIGGVHDGVHGVERRVQAVAGNQVNTERAADSYDLVSIPLKERHRSGTDVAGRTGHSDSHSPSVNWKPTKLTSMIHMHESLPTSNAFGAPNTAMIQFPVN
jgi:hypothetical protein